MKKPATVTKALLAVDIPHRWPHKRNVMKDAAVKSGYTSVRVSKVTLAALEELRRQFGHNGPFGENAPWGYYAHEMPMGEFLNWLAHGFLINPSPELVAACESSIGETHAKSAGGKSMQSPRPRRMHAGSVR